MFLKLITNSSSTWTDADFVQPAYQTSFLVISGQLMTVQAPRNATGVWFNGFMRIKELYQSTQINALLHVANTYAGVHRLLNRIRTEPLTSYFAVVYADLHVIRKTGC